MSVVCAIVTFPINAGLKLVPDEWCIVMGDEPDSEKDEAKAEYSELLRIANKYSKFRENSMQKYVSNKPGDSFKGK
jgi:hypothetical protein